MPTHRLHSCHEQPRFFDGLRRPFIVYVDGCVPKSCLILWKSCTGDESITWRVGHAIDAAVQCGLTHVSTSTSSYIMPHKSSGYVSVLDFEPDVGRARTRPTASVVVRTSCFCAYSARADIVIYTCACVPACHWVMKAWTVLDAN
jgi:hypothetical protein